MRERELVIRISPLLGRTNIRAISKETRKHGRISPGFLDIYRADRFGALFFEELAEWQFEAYNIWSTLLPPPSEMAQYRRG